jgi:hypothetical protein
MAPASAAAIAPRSRVEVLERATAFLEEQLARVPADASGRSWGIQANLAAGPGPNEQLDLQQYFAAPAGTKQAGHQLAEEEARFSARTRAVFEHAVRGDVGRVR